MSLRVVVTRSAARRLAERLPETVAAACVEFLFGRLAGNPPRGCGTAYAVRGAMACPARRVPSSLSHR